MQVAALFFVTIGRTCRDMAFCQIGHLTSWHGGFLGNRSCRGISDVLPEGSYAVYSDAASLAELVQMENKSTFRADERFRTGKGSPFLPSQAKEILEIIMAHPKLNGQRIS